jgi:excisionase family DNA binding protein
VSDSKLAYSPDGAAEKVSVGRDLIFSEIKAGRLVAKKSGRRTLIPAESLVAWMRSLPDAGAVQPGPA